MEYPSEAARVELSPSRNSGHTHADNLTTQSAEKASELLTLNHTLYHTRWKATFHNHMTHHLLALWALGATPNELQDMYDYNQPYQTSIERRDDEGSGKLDLANPVVFNESLGKDECYAAFLHFFENEIVSKGTPAVVKEYLLKGDERADDILGRMFTDLVHPMIHLGCGLEFDQPSIVAEALAGACVHDNWPKSFLLATERYVQSNPSTPKKPLIQTLQDMRNDPVIATGVKSTDPFNKIPDGLLKRVSADHLTPYLSQFQVEPTPTSLSTSLSEMMHTNSFVLGAMQVPGKREAIDFVQLHSVTLMVFYPAILALEWLSDSEKARLLEMKGRVDMILYAGCGSPALYPERIAAYVPTYPEHGWPELCHRANIYRDEGHLAKLIRALYSLEALDEEGMPNLPIKKADFVKIAHMALDSTERAMDPHGCKMPDQVSEKIAGGVGLGGQMVVDNLKRFVFYGGLDGAWQYVHDLEVGDH